jgi:hypothetical protein
MKRNLLDEIIGWLGMIFILSAYFLVSLEIVDSKNFSYQILNLVGSLGFVYISFKKKTFQTAILNIFWIIVTLISVFK